MTQALPASFQTQKSKMITQYDALGQSYECKTKPYISTQQFVLTVVDGFPLAGPFTMAHAVLKAGQEIIWFGYKLGDNIAYGPPGATRQALESDTNLSKARLTNGVEDFVIEGVSATLKSLRNAYKTGATPNFTYTGADPDAASFYLGTTIGYDPAALATPPQVYSPFNLEKAIYSACAPAIPVEFEWDRRRVEKIGRLDQWPEGGGKSFLNANGDPRTDNRYRIPEGYLWRREGQPDSEFISRARTPEAVVIPINLIDPIAGAAVAIPSFIMFDVTLRLHGLSLSLPSGN
jgi:hypothetical protein